MGNENNKPKEETPRTVDGTKVKNAIRLHVMLDVRKHHSEEYYKQAIASKGININTLKHPEIAAFKATMDAIEADIIIDTAENLPSTTVNETNINENLLKT